MHVTANVSEVEEIVSTLQKFPDCSVLCEVMAQDHVRLQTRDFFTLFAPVNQAWGSAPPVEAAVCFDRHWVDGAYRLEELKSVRLLESRAGTHVHVEQRKGQLRIGEAGILQGDIACANGFIHLIDRLL